MLLRVSDGTASSWNQLAAEFGDASLIQTWEWGEAKAKTGPWSVERLEFLHEDAVVGMAQVLLRPLPLLLGGMAWLNRGPLWDRGQGHALLPAMLRLLGERYVAERGLYLRIAPPLSESDLPEVLAGDALFEPAGMPGHGAGKIDLLQSEAALRAGLKQSWRRFLVKAERLGTRVVPGQDEAVFRRFLQAYGRILDTANYWKSTTTDFLSEFQRQLPPDGKMTVFEAVADAEPVSWVVIATHGDTGEYLAAASLPEGRRRNCGQLLTWHAMLHLKSKGFRVLDIGGFDPEDAYSGVSHFKRGTNAVPYRLCSEIDGHASGLKRALIRRAINVGRSPFRVPGPPGNAVARWRAGHPA